MRLIFNSGPWKWILFACIFLSFSGQALQETKQAILNYNLLAGINNDFYPYAENMKKVTFIRFKDVTAILGPLVAGFLIDKSRLPWIWLIVFALL